MNTPVLPSISPVFFRSSVGSVPSSTWRRRGLLRTAAPVLLALVLGVGIAGCDDASGASSDVPSSAAPTESQQDAGSGDATGSEETPAEEPAEEPAAEPTEDSGEGSKSEANSESESQKKSESEPEPQKEFYANCKAVKAAGAAPLYRGDPGYSEDLDRDGDGIACEK